MLESSDPQDSKPQEEVLVLLPPNSPPLLPRDQNTSTGPEHETPHEPTDKGSWEMEEALLQSSSVVIGFCKFVNIVLNRKAIFILYLAYFDFLAFSLPVQCKLRGAQDFSFVADVANVSVSYERFMIEFKGVPPYVCTKSSNQSCPTLSETQGDIMNVIFSQCSRNSVTAFYGTYVAVSITVLLSVLTMVYIVNQMWPHVPGTFAYMALLDVGMEMPKFKLLLKGQLAIGSVGVVLVLIQFSWMVYESPPDTALFQVYITSIIKSVVLWAIGMVTALGYDGPVSLDLMQKWKTKTGGKQALPMVVLHPSYNCQYGWWGTAGLSANFFHELFNVFSIPPYVRENIQKDIGGHKAGHIFKRGGDVDPSLERHHLSHIAIEWLSWYSIEDLNTLHEFMFANPLTEEEKKEMEMDPENMLRQVAEEVRQETMKIDFKEPPPSVVDPSTMMLHTMAAIKQERDAALLEIVSCRGQITEMGSKLSALQGELEVARAKETESVSLMSLELSEAQRKFIQMRRELVAAQAEKAEAVSLLTKELSDVKHDLTAELAEKGEAVTLLTAVNLLAKKLSDMDNQLTAERAENAKNVSALNKKLKDVERYWTAERTRNADAENVLAEYRNRVSEFCSSLRREPPSALIYSPK